MLQVMRSLVVLCVLLGVAAYDSHIEYGCNDQKCTFKFVLPEEIARFIDEKELAKQVADITTNMNVLSSTLQNVQVGLNITTFNQTFYERETPVADGVESLCSQASSTYSSASGLVQRATASNDTTSKYAAAMTCFQNGTVPTSQCFTLTSATTTMATTTKASTATNNPGTGTTDTPGTGTTPAPGTGTTPASGTGTTPTPVIGSTSKTSTVSGQTAGTPSSAGTTPSVMPATATSTAASEGTSPTTVVSSTATSVTSETSTKDGS